MSTLINVNDAPTAGANPWIDSLVYGGGWSKSADGVAHLNYSFQSGTDPYQYSGIAIGQAWTEGEKAAFKAVFAAWSAVAKVAFSEISNRNSADLWYWKGLSKDFSPNILGWHDMPSASAQEPLYGAFNMNGYGWNAAGLKPGAQAFLTILHEIGHGLGLSHPHEQATPFPGVTSDFGDYGTYNLNQGVFTTMSYNDGWATQFPNLAVLNYGAQMTPMALDIAAVQMIYGANMSYHTGSDTYRLPSANDDGTGWACIWDAGGYDRISAAGSFNPTVIDLRAATLTGAHAGGYVSWHQKIAGGFTIANSVVIEAATGGAGNDRIYGNESVNSLQGGDGNDQIWGMGGNDVIDSGAGSDTVYGWTGNDRLFATAGNDTLNGDGGIDTVDFSKFTGNAVVNLSISNSQQTGVAGFDKFAGIENILSGKGNDTLTGSSAANRIDGGAGGDRINGGAGDDTLVAGAGNDTYTGGNGSDTFSLAGSTLGVKVNLGLTARQFISSAFGSDVLQSIENITSSSGSDRLTGSAADNKLVSGAGNDVLDGGAGADAMIGGAGNDTYYLDHIGDRVTEYGSQGTDTIHASVSVSSFNGDAATCAIISANVENIHLTGADAISAKGNGLANTIFGNAAANTLTGGAGNDHVSGGGGDDVLRGGDGSDTLNGEAGADHYGFDAVLVAGVFDTILTFAAAEDVIELDAGIFAAAGSAGALGAGKLVFGTAAADADDYIIFDAATGALYYDLDTDGANVAVQFATLSLSGYSGTLSEANFLLV